MNEDEKRLLFIVNPAAGLGHGSQLEQLIHQTCRRHNTSGHIEFTNAPGHATQLSSSAESNGFHQVVAVGGDGTINEVAKGLLHKGMPMAIVPRGSGNGLARHLGIPLNVTYALDSIFDSRVIAIDTFTVNGKLSLNISGIGFDGHVTSLFGVKSTRGFIGYIALSVQEFFNFKEFSTEIVVSEKKLLRDAFIIAIANSSQYGNNAIIAPTASVCDGLLQLNIVRKVPFYRLDFLYSVFSGGLAHSHYCEIIEANSVGIKTSTPVHYHVDGEACGMQDTFIIAMMQSSLSVLVPKQDRNKSLV